MHGKEHMILEVKDMIDLDGMISIPFLKKTVFTGSHKGMNFMIRKQSDDEGDRIRTIAWPGPFIFSLTEEEKKVSHDSEFSPDGLKDAIEWLNEYYEKVFLK